jgi:hypothetical protein
MALLATLPRATRGHLGASNNTLTRSTRGWLQSAVGVVVRRPSGGLFVTPPPVEFYREERSLLVIQLDLVARVVLTDPLVTEVREPMVMALDMVGEPRLEKNLAQVLPFPSPKVTPQGTPAQAPAKSNATAEPAAAIAEPAPAPQRHPLTLEGKLAGGLWLDMGGEPVLEGPPPDLVPEIAQAGLYINLGGTVELTPPIIRRDRDEDLVLLAAMLEKELNNGR